MLDMREGFLARLPEIISSLASQTSARPPRSIPNQASMRSAISGEMAACSLSTRESAERPQDILTQRRAWVWGIEHATHKELLVRILVIDEYGIGAFEAKRQPPVAIDPNGEMPFQTFMQRMQPPSGHAHIVRAPCIVDLSQLAGNSRRMVRLHARLAARLKEGADEAYFAMLRAIKTAA
jgi:hypothetical protein